MLSPTNRTDPSHPHREDESRIRDQHLRENFAWLNRFTLTLLKQYPGGNSIAMKRRECGWNEHFVLEILTGTKTVVSAGPDGTLSGASYPWRKSYSERTLV